MACCNCLFDPLFGITRRVVAAVLRHWSAVFNMVAVLNVDATVLFVVLTAYRRGLTLQLADLQIDIHQLLEYRLQFWAKVACLGMAVTGCCLGDGCRVCGGVGCYCCRRLA